jgi:hypothetical protein
MGLDARTSTNHLIRTTLSLTALVCVLGFQNCGGFTAASGEAPTTVVTAFSSTGNGSSGSGGNSVTVISGFTPVSTPSSVNIQQYDSLAALQTAVLSAAALLNAQCSSTNPEACVMAALATEQAQNIAAAIASPGTAISVIAPFIPGIQTYINEFQNSAP